MNVMNAKIKSLYELKRQLSYINLIFAIFQGYSDIQESPFLYKNGDNNNNIYHCLSAILSPFECMQCDSSEGWLFSLEKTCGIKC